MTDANPGPIVGVLPAERAGGQVRAARLDRPLATHSFDATYADEHLEQLVRTAAEDARESARAQGYALGWAEGLRAAAEQAKADREARLSADATRQAAEGVALNQALTALDAAGAAVRRAESQAWEALADGLVTAAVQIVESLLARELAATDPAVLESVRTALRALGAPAGEVRLNPADVSTLRAATEHAELQNVTLAADPAVAPGTAQARLDDAQVLVDLPAVLAKIEAVLRG